MNFGEFKKMRSFSLVGGLALLLAGAQVFGQGPGAQATKKQPSNAQSIPNGAKVKFKGVVLGRDSDTFTMGARNRPDYQVWLPANTTIKNYEATLRFARK